MHKPKEVCQHLRLVVWTVQHHHNRCLCCALALQQVHELPAAATDLKIFKSLNMKNMLCGKTRNIYHGLIVVLTRLLPRRWKSLIY